jgi:hypothetical protein
MNLVLHFLGARPLHLVHNFFFFFIFFLNCFFHPGVLCVAGIIGGRLPLSLSAAASTR